MTSDHRPIIYRRYLKVTWQVDPPLKVLTVAWRGRGFMLAWK